MRDFLAPSGQGYDAESVRVKKVLTGGVATESVLVGEDLQRRMAHLALTAWCRVRLARGLDGLAPAAAVVAHAGKGSESDMQTPLVMRARVQA